MATTRAAKRRRAKARQICLSKRAYATDMEAAHTAGLQALKWNVKLYIYKCPVGKHWHLSRSQSDRNDTPSVFGSATCITSSKGKKSLYSEAHSTSEPSIPLGSGKSRMNGGH